MRSIMFVRVKFLNDIFLFIIGVVVLGCEVVVVGVGVVVFDLLDFELDDELMSVDSVLFGWKDVVMVLLLI